MIRHHLFVYGTLRVAQPAHHLTLPHAVAPRPATARGRLYAFAAGWPGMIADPRDRVAGDLLTLADTAATLARLDSYEGSEFLRQVVEVECKGGLTLPAWCYLLARPGDALHGQPIDGGDWLAYLLQRPS
jgi:gamma-glutamylcyclotransferase (GGCT)/AIG2-like uncharacterized protein YtfP